MSEKDQTYSSFLNKWENNTNLAFSETLREGSDIFSWIVGRNGFDGPDGLRDYLSNKTRVLDAGCGNGRVTALLDKYAPNSAEIVGIDLTAAHVAKENLSGLSKVSVYPKDLLGDLGDLGKFDFIYCQEVLHHTADPKAAFLNLCGLLAPHGEIAIYVYKIKAPVREFCDDLIRAMISDLPYDGAVEKMRQVTEFGKVLSELNINVNVPAVDVLDIQKGEYSIQRLIHHFFMKCFWNPELSYDENVAINYDWYHPQLCTRHTLDEIFGWFEEAGLKVVQHCVDFYGITVRGVRMGA